MSYIIPQDIYDQGVVEADYPTTWVQPLIDLWQEFIDHATGQFFEERDLEFFIDGTGAMSLWFQVPIITLEELYLNDDFDNEIELDNVIVYNGTTSARDDRKNPRISLKGRNSENFYARPRYPYEIFTRGHLNQKVKGKFGFLDGGDTPERIKFIMKKLVIQNLGALGDPGSGIPGVDPLASLRKKEVTDGHSIEYASLFGSQGPKKLDFLDVVQDPIVNGILKMFKAPRVIKMVYSTATDPEA